MIRTAIALYGTARWLIPIGIVLGLTICPFVTTIAMYFLIAGPVLYAAMAADGSGHWDYQHGSSNFLRLYGYLTIATTTYALLSIGGLAFSHSIGLFTDFTRPLTPTLTEFAELIGILWAVGMCCNLACTVYTFEVLWKDLKRRNGDVDF